MRRVLLFAGFLLLLGLTTAAAASFDVQAEDITSFSTEVSIEVPEPVVLESPLYVRGESTVLPGSIELEEPATNDSATKKRLILLSSEALQDQDEVDKFFTWASPDAPAQGYQLTGTVRLYISMFAEGTDRLTAGLLVCPGGLTPASPASLPEENCELVALGVSNAGGGGNGFSNREVLFVPTDPDATMLDVFIPNDRQLRLKIVNRDVDAAGQQVSQNDWELQWGYLAARQSRLEITS